MDKIISTKEAAQLVKDNMTIMVGGFMGCGTPNKLLDELLNQNTRNLTLISNDTAFVDKGVGKLIVNKQFKKLYASHIGLNPETGKQMNNNELEVELIPQGTLIERIRAAGVGLGGILTPTGVGTVVEEGKEKIRIDGVEYLLETPLKAEVALIYGSKVDKKGNVYFTGSTSNFNESMAMAAKLVIVEAKELVEIGDISPDDVCIPGLFIDYIVKG